MKLDVKGVMTHLWIDTSGLERRSVAARNKKIYRTISDGQMVENWQGFTGSVSTRQWESRLLGCSLPTCIYKQAFVRSDLRWLCLASDQVVS